MSAKQALGTLMHSAHIAAEPPQKLSYHSGFEASADTKPLQFMNRCTIHAKMAQCKRAAWKICGYVVSCMPCMTPLLSPRSTWTSRTARETSSWPMQNPTLISKGSLRLHPRVSPPNTVGHTTKQQTSSTPCVFKRMQVIKSDICTWCACHGVACWYYIVGHAQDACVPFALVRIILGNAIGSRFEVIMKLLHMNTCAPLCISVTGMCNK